MFQGIASVIGPPIIGEKLIKNMHTKIFDINKTNYITKANIFNQTMYFRCLKRLDRKLRRWILVRWDNDLHLWGNVVCYSSHSTQDCQQEAIIQDHQWQGRRRPADGVVNLFSNQFPWIILAWNNFPEQFINMKKNRYLEHINIILSATTWAALNKSDAQTSLTSEIVTNYCKQKQTLLCSDLFRIFI